jgi:deoxycytidine triphosphate deaminase
VSGVLSKEMIEARLGRGQIFRHETHAESQLAPASYDLRVASDKLAFRENGRFQSYTGGQIRDQPFILEPGEVAFVTSAERFCMPWDLVGNIGVKYRFASKGILVHTGMLVHPGFGLEFIDGIWRPKADARLHFMLANISSGPVTVSPGQEAIASIQFLEIEGTPSMEPVASRGDEQEERALTDQTGLESLAFYGGVVRLQAKHAELDEKVQQLEHSHQNILLFGIYLLATAFLGVVLTQILLLLSNVGLMHRVGTGLDRLHLDPLRAAFLVAVVLGVTVGLGRVFVWLLRQLGTLLSWVWHRRT